MKHHNIESIGTFQGEQAKPRTLLQTVTITSPSGGVVLDLPVSPWTRFAVEIDNWRSVGDAEDGIFRFSVDGVVQAGAADYAWSCTTGHSTGGPTSTTDDSDSEIQIVRAAASVRFGNEQWESYSFTVNIDPGNATNNLPKAWWQGTGFSDGALSAMTVGGGVYKGAVAAGALGRADQVTFENTGTIASGVWRLYGTE